MKKKIQKFYSDEVDICDFCQKEVKDADDYASRVKEWWFGRGFVGGGQPDETCRIAHIECYDRAVAKAK